MNRADKLGGLVVGCPIRPSKLLEFLHPYPALKWLMSLTPASMIPYPPLFGGCMHFDENGALVNLYADSTGRIVHGPTQCLEKDGVLHLAGLHFDGIATLKVK
jgi:hypothetical protein